MSYTPISALNVSTQKVQLTDNCYGACQGTTVTSVGTSRYLYHVGVAGGDIQLVFGLWRSDSTAPKIDSDPSSTVTFSANFEDAAGNNYAVTFNGARTVTLPGGGLVVSDPLPIDVAVGDSVFVRVYQSGGTAYLNRGSTGGLGDGGFTATTDLTATGAAAVGTANAQGFGPVAIIGTPAANRPKSVMVLGDSITVGDTDGSLGGGGRYGYLSVAPQYTGGGFYMRALSGNAGVVMAAVGGDRLFEFVAGPGHFRRSGLTRFCKYAIISHGRNDFTIGQTAAQLQVNILLQANRNIARGIIGNIVQTITPYATSTDTWLTTANQTVQFPTSVELQRVSHNNWVRAGCPIISGTPVAVGTSGAILAGQLGHPITGYLEVADVVESARDSGKWKPPVRTVTDAAITSGSATLTSATAAFTSADVGREVVVNGAGSSGGVFTGVISTINSSTSVTLLGSASTTVSGATCGIGVYTLDGIHPYTGGHTAIAAAIKTPLLAILT